MPEFPSIPDSLPEAKRLEWERALFDAQLARIEADTEAERLTDQEFYKAIFTVAEGSIERATGGADTVQKAATAIAALYTTLLGVVFSVKDHPLPSRGIIPMLFLGLSIVGSTAYLAYLTRAKTVGVLVPRPSSFERNLERARSLIEWASSAAAHRAYLLKMSVVALAVGLIFVPAAFVSFKSTPAPSAPPAAKPDWPLPSARAGNSIQLQKILYTAQVAESAEQRKQPTTAPLDTGSNAIWWRAALIALLVTLLAPLGIDLAFGRPQA
jgi:hypothetical protein